MVDVGGKEVTRRIARAGGRIVMRPETLAMIRDGKAGKGDVLGVARIAAIQAAKRTAELIPLAHPLPITSVSVEFTLDQDNHAVGIEVGAETLARTGVEMEALTAAAVGLLLFTVVGLSKKALSNKFDFIFMATTVLAVNRLHWSVPRALLVVGFLAIMFHRPRNTEKASAAR